MTEHASSAGNNTGRQWRIVALAVVSSSGRPLFLKNFPPTPSTSTYLGETTLASSVASTPSASHIDLFVNDAKKYLSPWAQKATNNYHTSTGIPLEDDPATEDEDPALATASGSLEEGKSSQEQQQKAGEQKSSSSSAADSSNSKMNLQQALSAALDCEDYTETETAQLFLYSALDRIDARRATEEKKSGNPFESRGYAVFDRETRTKMRAFVLVRYWSRSLPSECHRPCQIALTELIHRATYAYCDPFRDVALDEPLSESLVMDQFFTGILKGVTEMPSSSSFGGSGVGGGGGTMSSASSATGRK